MSSRKHLTGQGWRASVDASDEDSVVSLLDELFELLELEDGTASTTVDAGGLEVYGQITDERVTEILERLRELRHQYEEIDTQD